MITILTQHDDKRSFVQRSLNANSRGRFMGIKTILLSKGKHTYKLDLGEGKRKGI